MFTASKALTSQQAAHYYEAEYSRGDYYTDGDEPGAQGLWFGLGAAELGLAGAVERPHFEALLAGNRPTGEVLVNGRGGQRQAAWDFTCSADKTVSIAALALGDGRLKDAHDTAVAAALAELEARVETRARGGREVQRTGRMVAATFRHETSRALDPQLHTHCVILNATRRGDGEWRAVHVRRLFQAQRYATVVYRAEMARSLERLGYEIDVRPDGSVGIKGIGRDDVEAFSRRRQEILAKARELADGDGLDAGAGLKQQLAHSTRQRKRHADPKELAKVWGIQARERGLDRFEMRVPRAARRSQDVAVDARRAVAYALDHLGERNTALDLDQVEQLALERGLGAIALGDVRSALDERSDLGRDGELLVTAEQVALERRLLELAADSRTAPSLPDGPLLPGLDTDQVLAARHVLSRPEAVLLLEGRAGTGKSYTLAAVRTAGATAGWNVTGLAPTTSAAKVLSEASGLRAQTVARFLRAPHQLGGKQLWLVDEAGLLSTASAVAVLEKAKTAGAKVVFIGDRLQHHGVEAGRPFVQLMDAGHVPAVQLERVRRQRNPELRAAVEKAAAGNAVGALRDLDRDGGVTELAKPAERLQVAARHYVEAAGRGEAVLVTVGTNEDRRAVNKLIRQARIEAGEVQPTGVNVRAAVSRGLTHAQRRSADNYALGDLLTFYRASHVYGVQAGERAFVTEVDLGRSVVRARAEDGRLVEFCPRRFAAVEVGRASTLRLAVGDRVEFRAADAHLGVVNGSLGEIEGVTAKALLVRLDGGSLIHLPRARPLALDYGYATTSHRAQGRTVDTCISVLDSSQASRERLYVDISRPRDKAVVITDDRGKLYRRLAETQLQPHALDVASLGYTPVLAYDHLQAVPGLADEFEAERALWRDSFDGQGLAEDELERLARRAAQINVSARYHEQLPPVTRDLGIRLGWRTLFALLRHVCRTLDAFRALLRGSLYEPRPGVRVEPLVSLLSRRSPRQGGFDR